MGSHELKSLETRLSALRSELDAKRAQRRAIEESEQSLQRLVSSLESQIKRLTERAVVVTEHAILRYMERVHGIKLDDIIREILGVEDPKNLKLPNGVFQIPPSGHKIKVKNGMVVTVITKDNDRD